MAFPPHPTLPNALKSNLEFCPPTLSVKRLLNREPAQALYPKTRKTILKRKKDRLCSGGSLFNRCIFSELFVKFNPLDLVFRTFDFYSQSRPPYSENNGYLRCPRIRHRPDFHHPDLGYYRQEEIQVYWCPMKR